ncbi:MAG: FAD:protein FMN transferase [Acidimicrobiales bacterium]
MNQPVEHADQYAERPGGRPAASLWPAPPSAITVVDRVFPVMGSTAHVLVVLERGAMAPAERLLDAARVRLEQLEDLWSRFRPHSEIARLNGAGGAAVPVSRDTGELLARCVHAWRATLGLFDPTVHDALVRLGYDRSYEQLPPIPLTSEVPFGMIPIGTVPEGMGLAAPGCAAVEIDRHAGIVRLAPGVAIDAGGIGKGLAADLVVAELLAAGAVGAMVNVGGDTVVEGRPPRVSGWQIGIADPRLDDAAVGPDPADGLCAVVGMTAGAVVTSSRSERRWGRDGRSLHHLIDPRTGLPAGAGLQAVTVMSSAGWWAEALATAAFVAGVDRARELLASMGATGFAVLDDGTIEPFAGFRSYLR